MENKNNNETEEKENIWDYVALLLLYIVIGFIIVKTISYFFPWFWDILDEAEK